MMNRFVIHDGTDLYLLDSVKLESACLELGIDF